MRYGGAIFLIVVGAVVTFAVDYRVNGVNLNLIGVILMLAGAAALLLELALFAPRRRQVTRTTSSAGYGTAPVAPNAYGTVPVERTTVSDSRF